MPTVKSATSIDQDNWNQFVASQAIDNHCYNWNWQEIIANTFGHQPFYLIAIEDNKTTGILPLFLVKSILFGKSLISLPYLNGGGVIAINSQTETALINHAIQLSDELKAKYLELRFRKVLQQNDLHLTERAHKVTMKLELANDPDQVYNSFSSKLRSQIRRPIKEGATTVVTKGYNLKALNDFYFVFSRNMRDLGTPVYSKHLFKLTQKCFDQKLSTIVVYRKDLPVSAGITIHEQQNTEILWGSSLRSENNYSPNMLMYWEAIKDACQRGSHQFDFGRANPNSGTYRFKAQWGSRPLQLYWYYHSALGDIPDINPKSKKFELLVATWRKLPIAIANAFGPWLTKSLP